MSADREPELPPHDIEAEIAILGSMILDAEAVRPALEILTAGDFYRGQHGDLFRVLDQMAQDDEAIDLILLRKRLQEKGLLDKIGGTNFLSRVMATVPTTANAPHYAKIVRDLSRRRDVVAASARFEAASRTEDSASEWAALEMARRRLAEAQRGEEQERPLALDDAALMFDEPEEGPPEPLIDRLVVRPGVVIMFGASGSGKSWALMAGMYDLVHGGGTFCGVEGFQIKARTTRFGDEPDRVLWVYGSEDNRRRIKRRVRNCGLYGPHAGKKLEPGLFIPANPPAGVCLGSAAGLAWLRKAIQQSKATVVVLDTIQSLVSSFDINKSEFVSPFMVALHRLRDEFGAVIFPVHHTSKTNADAKAKIRSKADSLLGSQAWRALADGVVMIDAVDGDASDAELRLVKGKDIDEPPAPVRMTMESDSKRFRPLAEGEEAPSRIDARQVQAETKPIGRPPAVTVADVLKLQRKHPDGIAWATIFDTLGVGRSTWFRVRTEIQNSLLAMGHVVVSGTLQWKESQNSPESRPVSISGHPSVPESRNGGGGVTTPSPTPFSGHDYGANGPKLNQGTF